MQNSLSDAINTALTAAATEAVDATITELFAKTIDNAVKDQAKRLKKAFAAAVTRRLDHLNAVRQKETEMRIDKAVKKAVLDARVEEMEFAIELESEFCDKVESDDADPKNRLFSLDEYFHMRMDEWKNELAELGEVQEEKV
ncbi:hypothetical protein KCU69_g12097, partial [Aureobasidium melanogenum]